MLKHAGTQGFRPRQRAPPQRRPLKSRPNLDLAAVAERLPHDRDILRDQAHAAEALVLSDRSRLDRAVDAVSEQLRVLLLESLETEPMLADRI